MNQNRMAQTETKEVMSMSDLALYSYFIHFPENIRQW